MEVIFNRGGSIMKKTILFAFAIVITLVLSCNKQEVTGQPASDTEECGLVVKVTAPQTRMNYEDSSDGLVPTFKEGDRLIAYFRNSVGTMIGNAVPMSIDAATISTDKKTATFKSSTSVTIPSTAVSIFFYLDNETNGVFALSGASINNLKNQDGTLADVSKHQVIVGNALVSDLTDNGDGKKVANVTFVYKTSVLKLALTFPAGIVPTADDNTTITITDPDVYNSVRVAWGEPHSTASNNSKGAITVHPCSVSGQVATAYVTVWEKSVFDGATIVANVSGDACSVDFDAAGATVAGKVHKVERTLTIPILFDIWKNDDAGSYTTDTGLNVSASNGLTYNSATGAVTWDANTSAVPAKKSISFTNGKSAFVTQLEPKDFKGSYSFRSQRFSNNTTVATAAADVTIDVTIADPLVGEKLTDYDSKEYTNNLGLSGLYLDAVADAVLDIDYTAKNVRFGLFLDERKAQPVANGNAAYPYVCFIPEGGTVWNSTTMAKPWSFVPIPISATQNYQWLWFTVSEDFNVLNYNYGNKQFMVGTDGTNGTTIIGITCAVAKNATPAAADINTTYNVIYQANPNKKMDTGGFTLTRK